MYTPVEHEQLPAGTRVVVTRDGAPLTIATTKRDATIEEVTIAAHKQGFRIVGVADS